MKKILLLITVLFASFAAFSTTPTPTQDDADKIVLQRMSREARFYVVYANENLQAETTVASAAGEELELDYPCWVYYVGYADVNCCHGRYLFVNKRNGNMLELNAKSYIAPEDLAEWRMVAAETIKHVKTELGGCNNRAGLRNESEDSQENEVIVSASPDSVRVFVGLNYICKTAPFETKCNIENNTIRVYIMDTCMDLPDCDYLRCDCYYTFDFQFERKGETNYKYIVELISPWSGNRILAEGTIEEKNTPFSAAQMTNSVNQFSMEFFATAHDALKSDANIVLSPLSLNMALAMVWNGANGDTRQGIQQAMGMQNYAEKDVNNYFFHQENTTGTTLFMGKIGKP